VAGVDYAVGAPSGMALVTYSSDVEAMMHARTAPPPTSYLDLLQVQAYWSPERLNHHTAPTSLVYGLREALRLVHEEGLPERAARPREGLPGAWAPPRPDWRKVARRARRAEPRSARRAAVHDRNAASQHRR